MRDAPHRKATRDLTCVRRLPNHRNAYSLIHLTGGMDCKNAVYTSPQGEKAAISSGGIDCQNAAYYRQYL